MTFAERMAILDDHMADAARWGRVYRYMAEFRREWDALQKQESPRG